MGNTTHFSTKERILGAAEELFAQHGFAGTSLRQVTSRADVNIAAVNYHFGSKENLVNEVFRRRMDDMTAARLSLLEKALAQRPGQLEPILAAFVEPALALAQDRDVFALPGPANLKSYQGCHQLIRQGACLVQSGEDILRELQPRLGPRSAREAPAPGVREPEDPEQRAVHRLLEGGCVLHIDVLARQTGWAADKVSATLLFMELQGLVKQLPGMYYALAT